MVIGQGRTSATDPCPPIVDPSRRSRSTLRGLCDQGAGDLIFGGNITLGYGWTAHLLRYASRRLLPRFTRARLGVDCSPIRSMHVPCAARPNPLRQCDDVDSEERPPAPPGRCHQATIKGKPPPTTLTWIAPSQFSPAPTGIKSSQGDQNRDHPLDGPRRRKASSVLPDPTEIHTVGACMWHLLRGRLSSRIG